MSMAWVNETFRDQNISVGDVRYVAATFGHDSEDFIKDIHFHVLVKVIKLHPSDMVEVCLVAGDDTTFFVPINRLVLPRHS